MYDPRDPYHLFASDEPITQPIPVLSVAGPIRASEPLDPVAEVYSTPDPDNSLREMMWGLIIVSGLCPLIGVMCGFLGFVIGTLVGVGMAIAAVCVRFHRIKLINQGRTDLEFTDAEIKTENAIAAVMAIYATVKAAGWLERRHARHIGEAIVQAQQGNNWNQG